MKNTTSSQRVFHFNHPLIDRIKITDEWSGFGHLDKQLMNGYTIINDKTITYTILIQHRCIMK